VFEKRLDFVSETVGTKPRLTEMGRLSLGIHSERVSYEARKLFFPAAINI
jgi:hypothetical protein